MGTPPVTPPPSFRRIASETTLTPLGAIADNSACLHDAHDGYYRVTLRLHKEDAFALVDRIELQIEQAEQKAGTRLVAKLPFYAPTLPMMLDKNGVVFSFTTKQRPLLTPANAEIKRGTPAQVRYCIVVHALDRPGHGRALLQFNELLIGGKSDARRRTGHFSEP